MVYENLSFSLSMLTFAINNLSALKKAYASIHKDRPLQTFTGRYLFQSFVQFDSLSYQNAKMRKQITEALLVTNNPDLYRC